MPNFRGAFVAVCIAVLAGCGGSSESTSTSAPSRDLQGQLIDSPIAGVAYQRSTQRSSGWFTTGDDGGFLYRQGESLRFALGNVQLGEVDGGRFVTLRDLAAGDEPTMVNLARFFLTLDADGDPSNGINISQTVRLAAENVVATVADFGVEDFTAGGLATFARRANGDSERVLVSAELARQHVEASERDIADGQYDHDVAGDDDGDGVSNGRDRCPDSAPEQAVDDQGCAQKEGQQDRDGDGVIDSQDNCPAHSNRDQQDNDLDGDGDACDSDDDNDGISDDDELAAGSDPRDADSDDDGVADGSDHFPLDGSEWNDLDGDGQGDNGDADRDGDGVDNSDDAFPDDAGESRDADGDGQGDNADNDDDNDGTLDTDDVCPATPADDGSPVSGCSDSQRPQLRILDAAADENSGQLLLPLRLSAASPVEVQVLASFTDVDTDSQDFNHQPQLITIPAGVTEAAVAVSIFDDAVLEQHEQFSVRLSESHFAHISDGVAIATIYDDEYLRGRLRVGAAKRAIDPSVEHINGVDEPRIAGSSHRQKFNLGGFGVDPLQNQPEPFGGFGDSLTQPAEQPCLLAEQGSYDPQNFNAEQCKERSWVRAMYVEQPEDGEQAAEQVLFLVVDAVGAGNVIQQGMREAVIAATGLSAAQIVFGQTHTHAGADLQGLWGGVPQDWIQNVLYVQAAQAARAAKQAATEVGLVVKTAELAEFNNYRRPRQTDPGVDSDTLATLLTAIDARRGTNVGYIMQFNAHPTAINEDPRIPHPDYPLGVTDWLEQEGGTALYFNGPIADASAAGSRPNCEPEGYGDAAPDYGRVHCKGEGMAAALQTVTADREIARGLSVKNQSVVLPVTNPVFVAAGALGAFNQYYDFTGVNNQLPPALGAQAQYLPQATPYTSTEVTRITLGGEQNGLEIVTIPGEATGTFGEFIRSLVAPGAHTMLLGLTQNSFGYIIPEEEFSYLDPSGDAGLVVPFTGYEEMVSLGPLTAPLLRMQGYLPLFGKGEQPEAYLPPYLAACQTEGVDSSNCLFSMAGFRVDYIQREYAARCREQGGGDAEPLCRQIDPDIPLYDSCIDSGLPAGVCAVLGEDGGDTGGSDLPPLTELIDAAARGCDLLDPSHCLFPFPSDHFTVAASGGSIQSRARGGSGRRVNFKPLAMPRNTAGKAIDPREWNRSDGFSPGQLIMTYVPGLASNTDGTVPGAPRLTHLSESLDVVNSSVLVLNADTGQPHPVWAESNLNAGLLLPGSGIKNDNPLAQTRPALLIRPAKNFDEGQRYVVVLKNLPAAAVPGSVLPAQAAFAACRDQRAAETPVLADRCVAWDSQVRPVLERAGVATGDGLYLAWDFTVASAENNIGRLRHMRDRAFEQLGQIEDQNGNILELGRAPEFTIDKVVEQPKQGIARVIEGTITVPSFVLPVDPAPLDQLSIQAEQLCASAPEPMREGCQDMFEVVGIADGGSVPPNRLYFNPADAPSADADGFAYGDGLPDQSGEMTTRFTCQIPEQASTDNPARAGIYGHGLLDGHQAVNYDHVPNFSRDYNFLFCGVDLFGFATGDVPNVLAALVDLSNFAVIPDASQQGLLNFLYLARALRHPEGFGAAPEFRDADGEPLFDNREIFYDGNSQGGITGGPIVALSKDVRRGVFGVVGMNYSTLLRRSVDFDGEFQPGGLPPYAMPLYLSYQDDLDRDIGFALIQMLWDRSENNGYAHHITDNRALNGPDNQVLLQPAFADHQVTHWSAQVMARTLGVEVADVYVRRPGDGVFYEYADRAQFLAERDPDEETFWGLPLAGRDGDGYDSGECRGLCRSAKSALIEFDEGKTLSPPIGNVPPRADHYDPHGYPRGAPHGKCQKSHFLHAQGQLLDTWIDREVRRPADCPPLPAPVTVVGEPLVVDGEILPIDSRSFETAAALMREGQFKEAGDAVLIGLQENTTGALRSVMMAVGAAAGIEQPRPQPKAAPNGNSPMPLRAGIAKAAIDIPVGTPLGGYLRPPVAGDYIPGAEGFAAGDPSVFFDELIDFIPFAADGCDQDHPESCPPLAPLPDELRGVHSPYASYSPPSRGYYDSLIAKAIALYDGDDYMVFLKTDFIGALNELVEDVKIEVQRQTGTDLGDGLVLSATHSHDGPGAVANHSARYFWLAMDLYQHEVYRKVIGQLAAVVVEAMDPDAMRTAQVGHGSAQESLGMNGFRRGRLAHYDEGRLRELHKRLGVIRIDAIDGQTPEPLAVIINWAAHGIAFDVENQFFSGDVLASVERETEQLMQLPLAMLVQSTGGDISPRSSIQDNKLQRIESYGRRLAPQVKAIAEAIEEFQTAPDLRSVSQRIILDREHLGYAAEEFPYSWGAGQCGNDIAVPFADVGPKNLPGYKGNGYPEKIPVCLPSPPPDAYDLADNGVAENASFYPQDTIISAQKIGQLTLLVQPGEPLTEYGLRLLDRAASLGDGQQFSRDNTFVWGYAGDHVGYILPPEEEDWATLGGAESTTTFWGWKQGQRFIDVTAELLTALRDDAAAPTDEFVARYEHYRDYYDSQPNAVPLPSMLAGTSVAQPQSVKRFDGNEFVFEGGDPILGTPLVEMQHYKDGVWQAVARANGEAINTLFEVQLKYRLASGRHLWMVGFEAPLDWPLGEYRFVVNGPAMEPSREVSEYSLASLGFEVAPADDLQISPLGGERYALSYRPQPRNRRLIDPFVPEDQPAPLRAVAAVHYIDGSGVAGDASDAWQLSEGQVPSSTVSIAGDPLRIDVRDIYGNTGVYERSGAAGVFDRGLGLLGAIADLGAELNLALTALLNSDPEAAGQQGQLALQAFTTALADSATNSDPANPYETLLGGQAPADEAGKQALAGARSSMPLVVTGKQLAGWSVPAAVGVGYPYPSGATMTGQAAEFLMMPGSVRDAHNGKLLYPLPGQALPQAIDVNELAAFRWDEGAGQFVEIPLQVDEKAPYFLANANSDFSFYSGTDPEISYVWDNGDARTWGTENWMMIDGQCQRRYPDGQSAVPDPIAGLDDDDEVVFMISDAGGVYQDIEFPAQWLAAKMLTIVDPLMPSAARYVYLVRKAGGSSFNVDNGYVHYQRHANADEWIDRNIYSDDDPEQLGTSNTGYGANLRGTICVASLDNYFGDKSKCSRTSDDQPYVCESSDRFPRDGVTVTTEQYRFEATGRWMLRDIRLRAPGDDSGAADYWASRPDLIDRWKGRAFQQSPDSVLSLVGFEDEQVNWEANSSLIGERCGSVRCIREVWGADSGTNVTKTESFYRDAISYQYRVRVHPIPADGLYTSWDYNRATMVPSEAEQAKGVEAGRYFTMLRPQGVPIDGVNDDLGNVDGYAPLPGLQCIGDGGPQAPADNGSCPAFFDAADPTFNLPLAYNNWEQVAGKGNSGSMVYTFELVGLTSAANPLVVPYYRDDACLDDGTGDDPVARPLPGESYDWNGGKVRQAYDAQAGYPLDYSGSRREDCLQRQGAHGSHGIHFFVTHDSDNAFTPTTSTEIDARQWQFMVPTSRPENIAEPYANNIRLPVSVVASDVALAAP